MGRNAFTPGLLPGVGGIAYQLLRAHPEHDLSSILIPGSAWRVITWWRSLHHHSAPHEFLIRSAALIHPQA